MWEIIWFFSSIGCGAVLCLAVTILFAWLSDFLERKFGKEYPMVVSGGLLIIFLALSIIMAPISYVMKNRNSAVEVESK